MGAVIAPLLTLAGIFIFYQTLITQHQGLETTRTSFYIQQFEGTFLHLPEFLRTLKENIEFDREEQIAWQEPSGFKKGEKVKRDSFFSEAAEVYKIWYSQYGGTAFMNQSKFTFAAEKI